MKRRDFLMNFLKVSSAFFVGVWYFAKKADPRRFIRAVRAEYPGKTKKLPKIFCKSKWSG
ncbi:MAG: hypothetical protein ACYST2_01530 [Planctomycetota bacterium]